MPGSAAIQLALPHKRPMLFERHFKETALLASLGFAAHWYPALNVVDPGKGDTFESLEDEDDHTMKPWSYFMHRTLAAALEEMKAST